MSRIGTYGVNGSALRELRETQGLTLDHLGAEIGRHPQSIRRLETVSGKRAGHAFAWQIATALRGHPSDFTDAPADAPEPVAAPVPEEAKKSGVGVVPLGGPKAAGRVVLIDDDDFGLVGAYTWHVQERHRPGRRPNGPYAATTEKRDDRLLTLTMHKLITGWDRTDHINHNGLDNRRANLRPASTAQNAHNERPQIGTSSKYKGVTWHKRVGKWQAAIKTNGKNRYLGCFESEEEAALTYNAAAIETYGEFAHVNLLSLSGVAA